MLERTILPPETACLFDVLASRPELAGFTLMGGTALALQIGHRTSLDLDFGYFGERLPEGGIDRLMEGLKAAGHNTQLVTSPDRISRFKINTGQSLLDFARDYAINGVKVTFFAHTRSPRQRAYFQQAGKVQEGEMAFDVLGMEGLGVAKTLLLAERVRSRDLYDLYILMRDHGLTMTDIETTVRELGTLDDPEHYKAVLRGRIPLDQADEGLEPIGLAADLHAIYAAFNAAIDTHEIEQARAYFQRRDR